MAWKKKADLRGPNGIGVAGAVIDGGRLVVILDNGRRIDAGPVVGPQGIPGVNAVENDTAVAAYVASDNPTLTQAALDARYVNRAVADSTPVESVPFWVFGDSYGQGNQGASQESRPFNRIARRLRTQPPVINAVAGTRMDQVAANVAANWTPNSVGLVGISDGVINDVIQYGDLSGTSTTAEAFRTALVYLTARAVMGISSLAFNFEGAWNGGATSSAGAKANFAFNGDSASLLVQFRSDSGGIATVKDTSGNVVTSISTGGYKQNFTGVVKISGQGVGDHQFVLQLSSGSVTIVGLAIPSAAPPLIVWDVAGRYRADVATYSRLQAYQAAVANVVGGFPTVITATMGSGWDYASMISSDLTHRNDAGNRFATDRIERALRGALATGARQGLNAITLTTQMAPYATPAASAGTTLALDTFARADSTGPGTTEVGGFSWLTPNASTYGISGQRLRVALITAPADCYIESGVSDGRVVATLYSGSAGIVFRASGAGNTTGYILWRNGTVYTLSKRTGANAYTPLASTTGITAADGDVLTVVMSGSSITAFVNGSSALAATDSSYTGTRHGLWTQTTSGMFDNFALYAS